MPKQFFPIADLSSSNNLKRFSPFVRQGPLARLTARPRHPFTTSIQNVLACHFFSKNNSPTISRSPRALYATGRKAATHHAITPPLFLHNFWRSIPNVENKWLENAV